MIGHDWGRELSLVDCGLQLQKLGHVVEVLPLLCLKMLQDFLGWIMVLRWAIQGRNVVEDWNVRQRCWQLRKRPGARILASQDLSFLLLELALEPLDFSRAHLPFELSFASYARFVV